MKVLTKNVAAGTPVEFKFDASGSRFLIKNFTRSPISCKILDAAICIPANTSQMVATRQVPQTGLHRHHHRDRPGGQQAGGGDSVHGLLTEPEISGQMGYIGLSLGVYSHEGSGESNFVLSEGAFYVGILCDMTNVTIIKPEQE